MKRQNRQFMEIISLLKFKGLQCPLISHSRSLAFDIRSRLVVWMPLSRLIFSLSLSYIALLLEQTDHVGIAPKSLLGGPPNQSTWVFTIQFDPVNCREGCSGMLHMHGVITQMVSSEHSSPTYPSSRRSPKCTVRYGRVIGCCSLAVVP